MEPSRINKKQCFLNTVKSTCQNSVDSVQFLISRLNHHIQYIKLSVVDFQIGSLILLQQGLIHCFPSSILHYTFTNNRQPTCRHFCNIEPHIRLQSVSGKTSWNITSDYTSHHILMMHITHIIIASHHIKSNRTSDYTSGH